MKTRREFIKISTIGAGATAIGLNAFGAGDVQVVRIKIGRFGKR